MPVENPADKDVSSASSPPARRDWIDLTFRLATSWIGLFSAYVVALILALTKFKEFGTALHEMGLPQWSSIPLIAAFPLCALVFSTIPSLIEQRRVKLDSQIKGGAAGYFTLRPRETEEGFERVDNAHQEVLRWIDNSKEQVLYLTGASGTGKSSLLAAWVIPKLTRKGHIVIQLRGYEQLFERVKDRILRTGLIWTQPPSRNTDLRSLLDRASQRLGERRLIIVIDQFEEFLILKDDYQRTAFQELLSAKIINGLTFLLVYRPEYEGLIQDQPWPRLQLDTNRKVISPFTENAANEFLQKSGLTLNQDLTRAVLREAAEIEQGAVGLIRPVTINLCGLVLSRFSNGLPRKFRGGIIRGFLRESLLLPEVRDVAETIIPTLITDNVTKRPRTIAEMAQATKFAPSAIGACMRRMGESDRAIVRPLDEGQETWEISHDFLVPLLDAIIARRTVSLWRRLRPSLPWAAAGILGAVALVIPLIQTREPTVKLRKQGWTISEGKSGLVLEREGTISPEGISILRIIPPPYTLKLSNVEDISALRELKNPTELDLRGTKVVDISALRGLRRLKALYLSETKVSDVSALRGLRSLTALYLSGTEVSDLSALQELRGLTTLDLGGTKVSDISALRGLRGLATLDLSRTKVSDISALRELSSLTALYLSGTKVSDISAFRELSSLTALYLSGTEVSDLSALQELRGLTTLDLRGTKVSDLSALQELRGLTTLYLSGTSVTDVSALRELRSLKKLDLSETKVSDISALRELKNLTITGIP